MPADAARNVSLKLRSFRLVCRVVQPQSSATSFCYGWTAPEDAGLPVRPFACFAI